MTDEPDAGLSLPAATGLARFAVKVDGFKSIQHQFQKLHSDSAQRLISTWHPVLHDR